MEHGLVHGERDQAVQEQDEAQQRISSLQAKLDTVKAQKLETEGTAAGLARDLSESRSVL